MSVDSELTQHFPTATQWGTYDAEVKNGRLKRLNDYSNDPAPSIIGAGMLDAIDDETAKELINRSKETLIKLKEEVAINIDNSSILVPVELLNEEQINTTEEDKPTFSVVQGSQFSRTTVFVCVGGCQSEFENVNDGEDGNEIMCPHCGLIGDSPL